MHGDPVTGIDPSGNFFGVAGVAVGLSMSISLHLPTLVEGSLIALTLSTIGAAGGQLRRMGQSLLAAGDLDAGLKLYWMGATIISAAMYSADVISMGVGLFSILTSAACIARLAWRAAPALATIAGEGFGQFSRVVLRRNPAGVVRTIEEAETIAQNAGIQVPSYVRFEVDPELVTRATGARGPRITKADLDWVDWSDLANPTSGKVTFYVHPEVLESDDAIIWYFRHDLHEITQLKEILDAGRMRFRDFIFHVMPDNRGNLHDEAIRLADEVAGAYQALNPY